MIDPAVGWQQTYQLKSRSAHVHHSEELVKSTHVATVTRCIYGISRGIGKKRRESPTLEFYNSNWPSQEHHASFFSLSTLFMNEKITGRTAPPLDVITALLSQKGKLFRPFPLSTKKYHNPLYLYKILMQAPISS